VSCRRAGHADGHRALPEVGGGLKPGQTIGPGPGRTGMATARQPPAVVNEAASAQIVAHGAPIGGPEAVNNEPPVRKQQ
jgi:hypothetical protein